MMKTSKNTCTYSLINLNINN